MGSYPSSSIKFFTIYVFIYNNSLFQIFYFFTQGDPGLCSSEIRAVAAKSGTLGNITEEVVQE